MAKGIVAGFDLGTAYASVAVWKDGAAKIFKDEQGTCRMPACVSFAGERRFVGKYAAERCTRDAANTVCHSKRLLGRDCKHPDVKREWLFSLVEGREDKPLISVNAQDHELRLHPEEISAMILARLKQTAEAWLGCEIDSAVISVPGCFTETQRRAILTAGRIAGVRVRGIISDAAATGTAHHLATIGNTSERNVLIVDIGAGSTDVSVVVLDQGVIEVKAMISACRGGLDFDERLVDFCIKDFAMQNQGIEVSKKTVALAALRRECERAKISLSTSTETTIEVPSFFDGLDYTCVLSRESFEKLIGPDIKRDCIHCIDICVADSGIRMANLHEVLLLGESTHIPLIERSVRGFLADQCSASFHRAADAVVTGAAVYGANLEGSSSCDRINDILQLDVLPHSIRLNQHNRLTPIFPRHRTIPSRKSMVFTNWNDNTEEVSMDIYEGESWEPTNNNLVGRFKLSGIPPQPRGVAQLEVTFDVAATGILSVSCIDRCTGAARITTDTVRQLGLSASELASIGDAWCREAVLVVTLRVSSCSDADSMTISCTNVGGILLAEIRLAPWTHGLYTLLAEQLELPKFLLQVVLPSGRLLTDADDSVSIVELLGISDSEDRNDARVTKEVGTDSTQ